MLGHGWCVAGGVVVLGVVVVVVVDGVVADGVVVPPPAAHAAPAPIPATTTIVATR
jgi:hypothetical protein